MVICFKLLHVFKAKCLSAAIVFDGLRFAINHYGERRISDLYISLLTSPPVSLSVYCRQHCTYVGGLARWYNVGLWPANFPCPALDLQLMGDQ